jgi:hypothetical protein
VFVQITITAAGIGTGAGYINVVLPFTAAAFGYQLSGRNNVLGKILQGQILSGGSSVRVFNYDNNVLHP